MPSRTQSKFLNGPPQDTHAQHRLLLVALRGLQGTQLEYGPCQNSIRRSRSLSRKTLSEAQVVFLHMPPPRLRHPQGFDVGGDGLETDVGSGFGVDRIGIRGDDTVCYDNRECGIYEVGVE